MAAASASAPIDKPSSSLDGGRLVVLHCDGDGLGTVFNLTSENSGGERYFLQISQAYYRYTIDHRDNTVTLTSVLCDTSDAQAQAEVADLQRRHDELSAAIKSNEAAMERALADNATLDEIGALFCEKRKLASELAKISEIKTVRYKSVSKLREQRLEPHTHHPLDEFGTVVEWLPDALRAVLDSTAWKTIEKCDDDKVAVVALDAKTQRFGVCRTGSDCANALATAVSVGRLQWNANGVFASGGYTRSGGMISSVASCEWLNVTALESLPSDRTSYWSVHVRAMSWSASTATMLLGISGTRMLACLKSHQLHCTTLFEDDGSYYNSGGHGSVNPHSAVIFGAGERVDFRYDPARFTLAMRKGARYNTIHFNRDTYKDGAWIHAGMGPNSHIELKACEPW